MKTILKFSLLNALYIFAFSLLLNIIYFIYSICSGTGWFYYEIKALFYGVYFIYTKVLNLFHFKLPENFTSNYSILLNIMYGCAIIFIIFFVFYFILLLLSSLFFKKGKLSAYHLYFPTLLFILFLSYNFFKQALYKLSISFILSLIILAIIIFMHLFMNFHLIRKESLIR